MSAEYRTRSQSNYLADYLDFQLVCFQVCSLSLLPGDLSSSKTAVSTGANLFMGPGLLCEAATLIYEVTGSCKNAQFII